MTRLDALAMSEADARFYLHRKLAELAAMVEVAEQRISVGERASMGALVAKAMSAQEAQELWDATRFAVAKHEARQAKAV